MEDFVREFAASIFPLSLKREDCFAAGLSMGGYGAVKAALTYPERYGFARRFQAPLTLRGKTAPAIWRNGGRFLALI